MDRYCTQCGWKAPDGARFCGNCGQALSRDTESQGDHLAQQNQNDSTISSTYRKAITSSYDQLPLALNATDVAMVLGISRANAYTLMHAKDFPTIYIGKRMIVPKDRFLSWIEEQASR